MSKMSKIFFITITNKKMSQDASHTRELMGMIMQAMEQDQGQGGLTEEELSHLDITPYEGDDVQCSICLNNITTGQDVTSLPCDHMFHSQCIQRWFRRNATCPVCRAEQPRTNTEQTAARRFRLNNNTIFTFEWNDTTIRTSWSLQNHTLVDVLDFVSRLEGIDQVFQIQSETLTFKSTEGYNTLKKTLNRTGITGDMTFRVANHPNVVVFDII
jgi:hypothetical protein